MAVRLRPVRLLLLLALLTGILPAVGMDTGGQAFNFDPEPEALQSNCSHLTVKLEFSTKVVEHGGFEGHQEGLRDCLAGGLSVGVELGVL